jgi:hypothetical protein
MTILWGYVTDADTRSLSLLLRLYFSFGGANEVKIDRPTRTEKEMSWTLVSKGKGFTATTYWLPLLCRIRESQRR